MDQVLLPYLQATEESERQQLLDEILLVHAAPVVRQTLRRKLGFYVNPRGFNPHNQDAEDLYQEIIPKIVQTVLDLRNPSGQREIENLKQYAARIASNACNDALRVAGAGSPQKQSSLSVEPRDFAVWKSVGETLSGFSVWRNSSRSLSSEKLLVDIEERLANFRSTRFPRENLQQAPLTKIVAELFRWIGSPVELDVLVNIIATLLDVKDHPVESVDDDTLSQLDLRSQ